jgi:hypothetical protein
MGHLCAQVDCGETATHVVVEGHGLAMLFRSGAGLVCAAHARQFEEVGGVSLLLSEFRQACGWAASS